MFLYLLQGLGYGGAAAAQPGPFQAYLLSQMLKNGLRSTLVAAFAPLMSDGPIVLLVLTRPGLYPLSYDLTHHSIRMSL